MEVKVRYMEITGGGRDIAVPQRTLNDHQICTGFQQMGGEAVA